MFEPKTLESVSSVYIGPNVYLESNHFCCSLQPQTHFRNAPDREGSSKWMCFLPTGLFSPLNLSLPLSFPPFLSPTSFSLSLFLINCVSRSLLRDDPSHSTQLWKLVLFFHFTQLLFKSSTTTPKLASYKSKLWRILVNVNQS